MDKGRDFPPEMVRVAKLIAKWRKERVSMEPMPQQLWKKAVALADEHGVGPTSRGLKIDFGGLQRRCERHRQQRIAAPPSAPADEAVRFVELSTSPLAPPTTPTEASVELCRPDGAQMTVRLPAGAAIDLGGLVTSFLRQDR